MPNFELDLNFTNSNLTFLLSSNEKHYFFTFFQFLPKFFTKTFLKQFPRNFNSNLRKNFHLSISQKVLWNIQKVEKRLLFASIFFSKFTKEEKRRRRAWKLSPAMLQNHREVCLCVWLQSQPSPASSIEAFLNTWRRKSQKRGRKIVQHDPGMEKHERNFLLLYDFSKNKEFFLSIFLLLPLGFVFNINFLLLIFFLFIRFQIFTKQQS